MIAAQQWTIPAQGMAIAAQKVAIPAHRKSGRTNDTRLRTYGITTAAQHPAIPAQECTIAAPAHTIPAPYTKYLQERVYLHAPK